MFNGKHGSLRVVLKICGCTYLYNYFLHVLPVCVLVVIFTLCHVHTEGFVGTIPEEGGDVNTVFVQTVLNATAQVDLHHPTRRYIVHLEQKDRVY